MTLLAATGPLILVIVLSAAFRVPVFIASWCGAGLSALIALVYRLSPLNQASWPWGLAPLALLRFRQPL